MNCPGSVRLIPLAPPDEPSLYAERGTAAHWAAEYSLKTSCDPLDLEGEESPNGMILNQEDVEAVQVFTDLVRKDSEQTDKTVYTEVKFHLSKIHPEMWGTADYVAISEDLQSLQVLDYKHGAGVIVEVVDNLQLMYYTLGAIQFVCEKQELDYLEVMDWGQVFKHVDVGIIQPRAKHVDGSIRTWRVPGPTLTKVATIFEKGIERALKSDAPLIPGSHCRFCRALPICPKIDKTTASKPHFQATRLPELDFDPITS